jgi:hypothetical protein
MKIEVKIRTSYIPESVIIDLEKWGITEEKWADYSEESKISFLSHNAEKIVNVTVTLTSFEELKP